MARKEGRLTGAQRREAFPILWTKQAGRCIWCERAMVPAERGVISYDPNLATIEHVIPVSSGGTADIENLTLACLRCNNLRETTPVDEWLETIAIHKAYTSSQPASSKLGELFKGLHKE